VGRGRRAKTAFGSGFTVVNGSFRTSEVLNDPFTTLAVRAGCASSGDIGGHGEAVSPPGARRRSKRRPTEHQVAAAYDAVIEFCARRPRIKIVPAPTGGQEQTYQALLASLA
jgi:hypothetical protein